MEVDNNNIVKTFREKEEGDGDLINGGFMVLNPQVFDYIDSDDTIFEQGPLQNLVADKELMSFYHPGFWQCMDTQRERIKLETLWNTGKAPWKKWKD